MPQPSTTRMDIPELPTLKSGITLVDTGAANRLVPIHTLAVDQVCLNAGEAVWMDSGFHAITETLVEIAPSRRILDKLDLGSLGSNIDVTPAG